MVYNCTSATSWVFRYRTCSESPSVLVSCTLSASCSTWLREVLFLTSVWNVLEYSCHSAFLNLHQRESETCFQTIFYRPFYIPLDIEILNYFIDVDFWIIANQSPLSPLLHFLWYRFVGMDAVERMTYICILGSSYIWVDHCHSNPIFCLGNWISYPYSIVNCFRLPCHVSVLFHTLIRKDSSSTEIDRTNSW